MKVLILTTDAFGGHGGIAQYNRDLAEALIEIEEIKKVVVLARNSNLPVEKIPDKINFISGANSKIKYIYHSLMVCRKDFDLVICGHINVLPLAIFINFFIRTKLALIIYGIDVWKSPNIIIKKLLKKVNIIWSISKITRDRMNDWAKLQNSKYKILPNAIHLNLYKMKEKRNDLIEKYGLKNSKVIMTLARLSDKERYKGIDEVLNVLPTIMKTIPNIKYLIAGDGTDRNRLEKKSKELGLQEKVVFTGIVLESEKSDYFNLADAFVMPGRGEGFGFVFLEALACGIPTVGSKLDGSREALRGGVLGELVDPNDDNSVIRGIISALQKNKEIPLELNYFSWQNFKKRLKDSISELTVK